MEAWNTIMRSFKALTVNKSSLLINVLYDLWLSVLFVNIRTSAKFTFYFWTTLTWIYVADKLLLLKPRSQTTSHDYLRWVIYIGVFTPKDPLESDLRTKMGRNGISSSEGRKLLLNTRNTSQGGGGGGPPYIARHKFPDRMERLKTVGKLFISGQLGAGSYVGCKALTNWW